MMLTVLKDKLLLVLAALLSLTLASWYLMAYVELEGKMLGALLLLLAFIKVRLIIVHYMEGVKAQLPIRLLFEAWVFVVAAITIGLYL